MLYMLAPDELLHSRSITKTPHPLKVRLDSLGAHHLVLVRVHVQPRRRAPAPRKHTRLRHERMHLREEVDAERGGDAGVDDVGEGEGGGGREARRARAHRDGEEQEHGCVLAVAWSGVDYEGDWKIGGRTQTLACRREASPQHAVQSHELEDTACRS